MNQLLTRPCRRRSPLGIYLSSIQRRRGVMAVRRGAPAGDPYPTVRNTAYTIGDSSSQSITIPAHVAGDLLIVAISINDDSGLSGLTAGWTHLGSSPQIAGSGTAAQTGVLLGKIATGTSDPLSYNYGSTDEYAAIAYAITNHSVTSLTTDLRTSSPRTNSSTTVAYAATGLSGLTAAKAYLVIQFVSIGAGSSSVPHTPSTGFSNQLYQASGTSTTSGVSQTSARRDQAAGSTSAAIPSSHTLGGGTRWFTWYMAVPGP